MNKIILLILSKKKAIYPDALYFASIHWLNKIEFRMNAHSIIRNLTT